MTPASGASAPDAEERRERLAEAWSPPPGIIGFFTAVNHRIVGRRFMITAFVFFLLAGVEAVAMRLQLALPLLGVLSAEAYNQTFTMHGSTMMFLFVVPFVEGLGIYLVPLMVGAREMAFPRLNAFGYWVFLIAGVSLYAAYFLGYAPDGGWYNYPPLTGPGFSPGVNIDLWVTMVTFLEVSALVAAVELITTILKHRAPGMSLDRMPVFVWAMLVTSFVIVFAMPALVLTSLLLALDRFVGTHFFHPAAGGDPLLWQHLFWFFGHPDVYIMLLPAVGVVSMVIPILVRRALAGYTLVVLSTAVIGILSFGVWVHHMYTVGFATAGLNFFAAASMLITVPSAIQIFAWITTIWHGSLESVRTAMLFALAFIVLFILGGITGIMIASVPFNLQVHDTHFIVAHFHYTLVGGVVFPIFAAIYFWFPKVSGRLLDERLGRWHFWLFLVGFNTTFLLMHVTGLEGMPRRVYTYLPELGWGGLNALSTAGALLMGFSILIFLANAWRSWTNGRIAGNDPWGGDTLEWSVSSPPPPYNYFDVPLVRSRNPGWEKGTHGTASSGRPPWLRELSDAPGFRRENIITTALAAEPEGKVLLPAPSMWPLWLALALGVACLGAIWTPWLTVVGLALAFGAVLGWHLSDEPRDELEGEVRGAPSGLSPRLRGLSSTVVWGALLLVAIEGTVMALLLSSYFYLGMGAGAWPTGEGGPPGFLEPAIAQLALLASPVPVWLAVRRLARGGGNAVTRALPMGAVGVLVYLGMKVHEYLGRERLWSHDAHASIDWVMSGYAGLHAITLILGAGAFWGLALRGRLGPDRVAGLQALTVYWVFVALSGLLFFGAQYVAPHL